jgi:hypothetical protein
VDGSRLTVLSIVVGIVSIALRMPIITSTETLNPMLKPLVWLLGLIANVNWLGCFALFAPSMIDMVPPLIVLAAVETWVHWIAYRTGQLAWCNQFIPQDMKQLIVRRVSRLVPLPAAEMEHASRGISSAEPISLDEELGERDGLGDECNPDDPRLSRRSVEGVDEQGRRFLSGAVRVRLIGNQQTEAIVIGFCPAFLGDPEVDLDCDAEGVSTRLANCSPAGMRVTIRRARSERLCEFWLQWYAVEASLAQPEAISASQLLP